MVYQNKHVNHFSNYSEKEQQQTIKLDKSFIIFVFFFLFELSRETAVETTANYALNYTKFIFRSYITDLARSKWANGQWSNLMRSWYATKPTMQCTIFIHTKNDEMTKHPFYNEWAWCNIENAKVLFDNFEYRIVPSTNMCYYSENQVFGGVTIRVLCSKRGCY